jgi:hypothetical protein
MADFEANIGATSGLGGFATALPGAIDAWIQQNQQMRAQEAEQRQKEALYPIQQQMAQMQLQTGMQAAEAERTKQSYIARMLEQTTQEGGMPQGEFGRSLVGLKGESPEVKHKRTQENITLREGMRSMFRREEAEEKEERVAKRPQKSKTLSVEDQILDKLRQGQALEPGEERVLMIKHPEYRYVIDMAKAALAKNPQFAIANPEQRQKMFGEAFDYFAGKMGMPGGGQGATKEPKGTPKVGEMFNGKKVIATGRYEGHPTVQVEGGAWDYAD